LGVFKKISNYNKWKDLYKIKSLEVYGSLILTIILIFLFRHINFFQCFILYETPVKNISLSIGSALLGMLSIILAGIAIIIGMLNKDINNKIKELNEKDIMGEVLASFVFIAFLIAIELTVFYLIYLLLYSQITIGSEYLFYIIVAAVIYLFFFIIFYIIGLINNCIKIYSIIETYEEIINSEKNIFTSANELRIEFILHLLLNEDYKNEFLNKLSGSEDQRTIFLQELINYTRNSKIENKEEIIDYFIKFY
jgi:hypothetical protein